MVIGIIFIVVAIIALILICAIDDCLKIRAISIIMYVATILGVHILTKETKAPTALEVYQGKTTLEITYKDEVPIDSVVVYK